jgi:hypothetical protein
MNGGDIPVFHPFSPETEHLALFILVLIVCGVILAIVVGMIGYGLIFSGTSRVRQIRPLILATENWKSPGPSDPY